MPKIPRIVSQERPTTVPGMRVSPESMTQETRAIGQFAQTVAQVGGAISQVGIAFQNKLTDAEITSQYNLSKGKYKEELELLREKQVIDRKTDWEDVKKDADEYKKGINVKTDAILKQPKARQAFDVFKKEYDLSFDKESFNRTNSNRVAAVKAQTTSSMKLAIQLRDPDMAREAMEGAIESGAYDAKAGSSNLELALIAIEDGIDEDNYQDVWKVAREAPDKDTADTIIRGAELSAEQEKSLLSTSNSHFLGLEAKAAKEEEEAKETDRASLWDKEKEGTLTYGDIEATGLEQGEKRREADRLDRRNKALADGKVDPYTVQNDAIYGNMSELVSLHPEATSDRKIWDLHGEGLSTDNCKLLVKEWKSKTEDPVKAQAAKRAHSSLKSMKSAGIFGEDEEAEITWGKKANALDNYLSDNPDASNEDITTYLEGLVSEEKSNYFGEILDAYWNQLTFGLVGGINEVFPKKTTEYEKTATNPETGDKMGWDGEKWQKID